MFENQEFEKFLREMQPPRTVAQALQKYPTAFDEIRSWKRNNAVELIAGLQTELAYQANTVRLDWLMRLILSLSEGRKKPHSKDIERVLNVVFGDTKISRLEDPVEDVFIDRVVTAKGEFAVFTGHYEDAAATTQTVIEAFEALPPHEEKDRALRCAYALLALSSLLVMRSGYQLFALGEDRPWEDVKLPTTEKLRRLARRVIFTNDDLLQAGIERSDLSASTLQRDVSHDTIERLTGDAIVDLAPIFEIGEQIVIFNPGALTLAIRAVLLKTVIEYSIEATFLKNLMVAQLEHTNQSGFWPGGSYRLPYSDDEFVRSSILQFAAGRYVQVIQVMPTLDNFPAQSFGDTYEIQGKAKSHVESSINQFWQFLEKQSDNRQSRTILLMSTWGCGVSFALDLEHHNAPENWRFKALPYANACTLGVCADGKLTDIWRILEQEQVLSTSGFELHYVNGLLNLFGFWRETGGQFIPEHQLEAQPPLNVMAPTNSLLEPLLEAKKNQGVRMLPYIDGRFRRVQKASWGEQGRSKEIFASVDALKQKELLGALAYAGSAIWIECRSKSPEPLIAELQYQIWNASLEWLEGVRTQLGSLLELKEKSNPRPVAVTIVLDEGFDLDEMEEGDLQAAEKYISLVRDAFSTNFFIRIKKGWTQCLRDPKNSAEIALVSQILFAVCHALGVNKSLTEVKRWLLAAVGSSDWRWLHAKSAELPVKTLMAQGFTERFRRVPLSALALAKTNSVWEFYDRTQGSVISGDGCKSFLAQYSDALLQKLIGKIQAFDRQALVLRCLKRYTAGRAEHEIWRNTFLALRTIEGERAYKRAFGRQSEIFGTQRAAKVLAEIAAIEAKTGEGLIPSKHDLDDLLALTQLILGNGNLTSLISAGLAKDEITISPTGDLLADRSISLEVLEPSSEASSQSSFDAAAKSYARTRPVSQEAKEDDSDLNFDEGLRGAIVSEYGCEAEPFIDFQHALAEIAGAEATDVLIIRKSELIRRLIEYPIFAGPHTEALLNRLTLQHRGKWQDLTKGVEGRDLDVWILDRAHSLINRPLLALDGQEDALLAVSPVMVSEANMYALGGLHEGKLHGNYWTSKKARQYAGQRAHLEGERFENDIVEKLNKAGLETYPRQAVTKILDVSTKEDLGDIDVFCIDRDREVVWILEAKNLRLCRNEREVAARLYEYRGELRSTKKGKEPDKLLKHLRRVSYIRDNLQKLTNQLGLSGDTVVRGAIVVGSVQPMNFYQTHRSEDATFVHANSLLTLLGCIHK